MTPLGAPRQTRLLWQLFPSFVLVALISIIAIAWYGSYAVKGFYLSQLADDLAVRASLVRDQCGREFDAASPPDAIDTLCKRLGEASHTRITVILPDGTVAGDSERNPAEMENHGHRPEIVAAFGGSRGVSIRFSDTLQKRMMYVAIPLIRGDSVALVVRTSIPATAIDTALKSIHERIALGSVFILLLAAAVGLAIARSISRPLVELKNGATRFASGDLGDRVRIAGSAEIDALAGAMNTMAEQLNTRIQSALQQRNELEAVLSSMVEGVLAVDTGDRVIRLNRAAARFLGVEPEHARGKILQEIVRNPALHQFIVRVVEEKKPIEGNIALRTGAGERSLQVHGAPLVDTRGARMGALIVLNDMTKIRRLENVRRDFVANVSHELKTPITSIQGFVETLQTGGIDDQNDTRRFLDIIARQTDRLNMIIDDLLTLSRIEQEADTAEIELAPGDIAAVLRTAADSCRSMAESKRITIDLACEPGIRAAVNGRLLEQALINLIDNAIKYSDEGGKIEISAERRDGEVVISVRDWGCGIAEEHLPRLFERFYRVDKARSRKLGGTGLGLAIVKHIVLAHGARIEVESTPGAGSTFFILLPDASGRRSGEAAAGQTPEI